MKNEMRNPKIRTPIGLAICSLVLFVPTTLCQSKAKTIDSYVAPLARAGQFAGVILAAQDA
jgi:hypothetical protein